MSLFYYHTHETQVFVHVRHLDSNIITSMDHYGQLLQRKHAYNELNQLSGAF